MRQVALVALLAAVVALSQAGPACGEEIRTIELTTVAQVEIETVNEDGKKDVEWVDATRVVPGDEIVYTIYYTNAGRDLAENVLITNPIPEHMLYVDGSATGTGTVVAFSVDGGRRYAAADELTVIDSEGNERPAGAWDYTHIRWTVQRPIGPNAESHVGFRALLE